ncbi:MAG: cysteine desulfurase [Chlamydiota bacterium]
MLLDLNGPPGNPSSQHAFGQKARQYLLESRETIASYFGIKPNEIVFTASGTEAINLFLRSLPKGAHLITSDVEHASLFKTAQFIESQGVIVTPLNVGKQGIATPEAIEAAIRPDTAAIALGAANGETGVKLDLARVAALAEKRGIPLLIDAVAYIGKESFVWHPGITAVALSGHKFHAPKGIGALLVKHAFRLTPLLSGGNQEGKRRAGTENVSGILGLAKAVKILQMEQPSITTHLLQLRMRFEEGLKSRLPNICIHGEGDRIASTCNIAFLGHDAETLLIQLDLNGIAAATGSACSTGALELSRVLLNMGIPRQIVKSSLRFSMGRMNTIEEIDTAIETIAKIVQGRG